jgi:phage terminase Nu1 subunit (DNA packaging protein)
MTTQPNTPKRGGRPRTPSPTLAELLTHGATRQQVAALFGVPASTVDSWKRANAPMRLAGKFDVPKLVAWLLARAHEAGRAQQRKATGGDGEQALTRWREARAGSAELQLAKDRGLVHSREDCERDAVRRLRDLLTAFAGLPDRCARLLFNAPAPEWIKEQLVRELRSCFADLQRSIDEQAAGERDQSKTSSGTVGTSPAVGTAKRESEV